MCQEGAVRNVRSVKYGDFMNTAARVERTQDFTDCLTRLARWIGGQDESGLRVCAWRFELFEVSRANAATQRPEQGVGAGAERPWRHDIDVTKVLHDRRGASGDRVSSSLEEIFLVVEGAGLSAEGSVKASDFAEEPAVQAAAHIFRSEAAASKPDEALSEDAGEAG